jgi:hypothetical protein
MATFEALALVTDSGKARIAQLTATGKAFKVDRFVIGANGHDPIDNTIAITPDPSRTDCYCSPAAITVASGCIFEGLISSVTYTSQSCPVYQVELAKGQATGIVSSVCLLGTIVYSPTPNDPELGTRFLFAITNLPIKVKLPQERFVYNISVQV